MATTIWNASAIRYGVNTVIDWSYVWCCLAAIPRSASTQQSEERINLKSKMGMAAKVRKEHKDLKLDSFAAA